LLGLGSEPLQACANDELSIKNIAGYNQVVSLDRLDIDGHQTQSALQQFACLGNGADMALLSLALGQSQEKMHAPLWEAVRTGLILRLEGSYNFLHDRIQEAAYALIPESERAGSHLRIGRALLASLTAEGLAQHLFDVANQLNRGAELLGDHDEKVRVAAIDLEAGRKAKASAAYASACEYFAAGLALLGEADLSSQYELRFSWRWNVRNVSFCAVTQKQPNN
jgi:predicted ATPase